jgi:hypothetical protein
MKNLLLITNIVSYKVLLVRYASHIIHIWLDVQNKSIAEILNTSSISSGAAKVHASSSSLFRNDVIVDDFTFEGKVILATEDSTDKFCKLVLKDRSRLSKENSLTVCEYIIAMKKRD